MPISTILPLGQDKTNAAGESAPGASVSEFGPGSEPPPLDTVPALPDWDPHGQPDAFGLPERERALWGWCRSIRFAKMLPPDLQSSATYDSTQDIFLTCSLGADLGLNRFQSLYGLYRMPNGQLTISTQCKRIIVALNGGRFVEESFDEETGTARCVIEKDGTTVTGTFSVEDAKAFGKMVYNAQTRKWEGTATRGGGDTIWKRDWRHMLAVRACSRACDKALAGTAGMLASTEDALDGAVQEKPASRDRSVPLRGIRAADAGNGTT